MMFNEEVATRELDHYLLGVCLGHPHAGRIAGIALEIIILRYSAGNVPIIPLIRELQQAILKRRELTDEDKMEALTWAMHFDASACIRQCLQDREEIK